MRAHIIRMALCAMLVLGLPAAGTGDGPAEQALVRVVTVAEGFDHPWAMAFLPDGRFLVTERVGRLRLVTPDGRISPPLEGLPEIDTVQQGGLFDVVLDPDFATNRLVYLSYAERGPGGTGTAVARGRLGEGRLEEVQVIYRQEPKLDGGEHFGSRLVFSREGYLFVTLGDRGQRDRAQDLSVALGKIVRIRPDGSVPPDNPFVGRPGARPEIWSYGHRNVQGAALHPDTGQLWIAEHGPMGGDEINTPRAGRNYGWPVVTYGVDYSGEPIGEGTSKPGMEEPVFHWNPSIAPGGMTFYTGDRFPQWHGRLFVGSLKFGSLSRLDLDGEQVVREERILEGLPRLRDVRQGPDGFLYVLTETWNGRLLRLEPAS